jgi:hypothetical protein
LHVWEFDADEKCCEYEVYCTNSDMTLEQSSSHLASQAQSPAPTTTNL